MDAPLFDVKNKLSEYVKIAENGEPVQICKRGEASVVLVSIKDYLSPKNSSPSIFDVFHNKWLAKCKGSEIENDSVDDFINSLEADRKIPESERQNPFSEQKE